jgi:hypothetical protein
MIMKRKIIASLTLLVVIAMICPIPVVSGEEYGALTGVKSAKAVFDDRVGNPKSALSHLKLIHQTYKELTEIEEDPGL